MHKNFLKGIYRVYKVDSAFRPIGSLGTEVQPDWVYLFTSCYPVGWGLVFISLPS